MARSAAAFLLGLLLAGITPAAFAQTVETEAGASVVMSRELLEGAPTGAAAEGLHVHANVRAAAVPAEEAAAVYQAEFRVDSGAAESVAPASLLEGIGIIPVGTASYTRPDGTVEERPFGIVRLEFMGEMREGRIVFGPEDVEPCVGVSALQAIGLTVDGGSIQRLEP